MSAMAIVLAGCLSAQSNAGAPNYRVYPVSAVGHRGVPRLDPDQLAWLRRVEHSYFYRDVTDKLWFAPYRGKEVPLIVIDGRAKTKAEITGSSRKTTPLWVIGDDCYDGFDVFHGEHYDAYEEYCAPNP